VNNDVDVVVLGLGPAGRAAANACVGKGLSVTACDPAAHRRWTATYGAWSDELPPGVPVAVRIEQPVVWTDRRHQLTRGYSVLDTVALQRQLSVDGVDVRTVRADVQGSRTVQCSDGQVLRAGLILDARGSRAAGHAQQTAYGVVVPRDRAEPALLGAQAVFMDWRTSGELPPGAPPSFLYALPLDDERVLLEETCLAGHPALGFGELRRRLECRLSSLGVALGGDEPVERVRFALHRPLPWAEWAGAASAVPRVGAAGGLVHPATGYSVATSLRLAPAIATAAAGPDPARGVQRVLWPSGARTVHALRLHGLRVVLGLAPQRVPEFFTAFFDLPAQHQQAYLSNRDNPIATVAAMSALLPRVSWGLRRALILGGTPLRRGSP